MFLHMMELYIEYIPQVHENTNTMLSKQSGGDHFRKLVGHLENFL
jgi:hypothetical protein